MSNRLRLWRVFGYGLLILILTGLVTLPTAGQEPPPASLYLPLITEPRPERTVFGLETSTLSEGPVLNGLIELNPTWIRHNSLTWAAIEPLEGAGYRWDAPATAILEQELINTNRVGAEIILVVQGSPAWAVAPYTANCAPINPDYYAAFARFLAAAVERYSQPPYNVRYWEIGNEPDATIFASDSGFGCWGDPEDPYYGGRAYGEMLKVVYPAIKAADPQAIVLFGGLLLFSPYNVLTGEGVSSRFLEGALLAGAGDSFDVLAYHGYGFYDGTPEGNPSIAWKSSFLRATLAGFGLDKPLINTEGALLCAEPTAECREAQAYAVPRIYARAIRDGLLGFIWYIYDSDSFRHTALIEPAQPTALRPAYLAYRHARQVLRGAEFSAQIDNLPPGAEGYLFTHENRAMLVLWSSTPQLFRRVFSSAPPACSEWDGSSFACPLENGLVEIEIGIAPRYMEWLIE